MQQSQTSHRSATGTRTSCSDPLEPSHRWSSVTSGPTYPSGMGREAGLLAVVMAVSACAGQAAETTTTTTVLEPPTTSTTTTVATTTTGAAEPVNICGRARLWEPGVVYTAPCFIVPNSFAVAEDGWRSALVQDRFVYIPWLDPSDTEVDQAFEVGVAVTATSAAGGVDDRVVEILETEGITLVRQSMPTVIAGLQGASLDVGGEPRLDLNGRECQPAGDVVYQSRDRAAYPIAAGPGGDFFGVGRCQVVRVWVLEAGSFLLTIIGGTASPDRHEEAVAKVEELFGGMTFELTAS